MSPADPPVPSVRVEYGDTDHRAPLPSIEPSGENSGATGKRALVIAAVALIAVVGLIVALAPNSGSTAAGTPITTTTVPPPATEPPPSSASDAVAADEEEAVSSSRDIVDPVELFESADSPFLAFNVIAVDVGWFVHGFDQETQEGALYRSQDGLNWDRLSLDGVANGLVVGFERIGDSFVVAIDEASSWSDANGTDIGQRGYEISFWTSQDAANWVPAPGRPTTNGEGFPYPVLLSESATMLPVIGPPDSGALSELVEYLAEVAPPEVAAEVCMATSMTATETQDARIVFSTCDADLLFELSSEEADAVFGSGGSTVESCVGLLRSLGSQVSLLRFIGADGTTTEVDLRDSFALFGEIAGSTFLSPLPSSDASIVPDECGVSADDPSAGGLLRWTPEDGVQTVELPQGVFESGFLGVATADDGTAYLAGESAVLTASPPYTEWELLEIAGAPAAGLNREFAGITVAADASAFMATSDDGWLFARPGDDEWTQVAARSRDFGTVLLAGADFVIVELQRPTTTLVKVPLS